MLPGSQENWSFSLKSTVKEDTSFEMLASMYDASLDQILPFEWNQSFWPDFYAPTQISSSTFGTEYMNLLHEQLSIESWRFGFQGPNIHYRNWLSIIQIFGCLNLELQALLTEVPLQWLLRVWRMLLWILIK